MAYGTVNADVISTSVANTSLGAGNATRFKNRIINGAMVIDQRNAGASVTPTTDGTYTLDRWSVGVSASSKFSVQQNAGSVTPPAGFTNYLGITSSSAYSVAAGDYFYLQQRIEGYNVADLGFGTANAKTVTLSFWVRSSLTGTFGGSFTNSSRSYPFTYTISSANTWTQISVTIAGDTSGTWLTTNGLGLLVSFGLGVGTTYSTTANAWASGLYVSATGATSVVGTSGATFYITGVQLEVGSSATGFEYVDYGTQLQMCQRYFEIINITRSYNAGISTTYAIVYFPFEITKRTAPTLTYVALTYYSSGTTTSFTPNKSYSTTTALAVGSDAFTSWNGFDTGTAQASAEL